MRIANYRHPRFWSNEKTKMLLELRATKVPNNIIAEKLGITIDAVNGRLRTLGISRRPQFHWTPEADARLIAYYQKPKSKRETMKVELRSWPTSPTPDAAYVRATQLKLTKNVKDGLEEQDAWLEKVALQKKWKKQMAALEDKQ